MLVPCFILAIILVLIKKYKIQRNQIITFIILFVCFILTPANWWGRYSGFIILAFLMAFSIVHDTFYDKKIFRNILNGIILVLYLAAIYFGTYYAFYNYSNGYYKTELDVSQDFSEYINSSEGKNILFLEESYYEGAKYLVYLKGNHFQNRVNTYYIEEMYKNAGVKNHKIETYENFVKLIDENVDAILIVDSNNKRKNYEFLERFYNENKDKYERVIYGENIRVCKKII